MILMFSNLIYYFDIDKRAEMPFGMPYGAGSHYVPDGQSGPIVQQQQQAPPPPPPPQQHYASNGGSNGPTTPTPDSQFYSPYCDTSGKTTLFILSFFLHYIIYQNKYDKSLKSTCNSKFLSLFLTLTFLRMISQFTFRLTLL